MKTKPQRNWTDEENKTLIRLKERFYTNKQIALKLGRTETSVKNRIAEIRLHTEIYSLFNRQEWSEDETNKLINLRNMKLKWREIAHKLNRTEASCREKYKRIL